MSWWRKLVSGKKNTSMANVVAQGCVSNKRYHKYSSGTLCNWLTVIKHS